jgi:hypothetical protein
MLELDAHIGSYFNCNNAIKLNPKENQIIYLDQETAVIPGRFRQVDRYRL